MSDLNISLLTSSGSVAFNVIFFPYFEIWPTILTSESLYPHSGHKNDIKQISLKNGISQVQVVN